jgi:hypothetical protein
MRTLCWRQKRASLRARSDFHELGSVRSETGRWFYLFGKTPKFQGFELGSNVGEEEGPYPGWHLPIVRWVYAPVAKVEFDAPRGGMYRISADGRSPAPGQVMTFLLDGQVIGSHRFEKPVPFDQFDIPFQVKPGHHTLEMHFSSFVPSTDDLRKWGALFKKLQLLPPAAGASTQPTTQPQ